MGFGKNLLRIAHSAGKRRSRGRSKDNSHEEYIQVPWYGGDSINYSVVSFMLTQAGFLNVTLENLRDLRFGILTKEGSVKRVTANGVDIIIGAKYLADTPIVIYYHGKR